MKNILLVEDHEELREIFADILGHAGYKVLSTANGEEAQAQLIKSEFKIDLIITDIIMPRLTGLDLRQWVQKINQEIRFLFVSGYMEDKNLSADLSFLAKPFSEDALLQKIREVFSSTESRTAQLHPLVS